MPQKKKALARIVTNEIRSTRANLDGRENETGLPGGEEFDERRAGKSENKTIVRKKMNESFIEQ